MIANLNRHDNGKFLDENRRSLRCAVATERRSGRPEGDDCVSAFWQKARSHWAHMAIYSDIDFLNFLHLCPYQMALSAKSCIGKKISGEPCIHSPLPDVVMAGTFAPT